MLTTVKRAVKAGGRNPDDLTAEESFALVMAIAAASAAIEDHCNRELGLKTHHVHADGSGTKFLRLRNYPIHSASVVIGEQELEPTRYRIESENGMLFKRDKWPEGDRLIEVEYSAGYVLPSDDPDAHITLPRNYELACILYAQMLATQTPGVSSERVGDISVSYQEATAKGLPPAVAALLRL